MNYPVYSDSVELVQIVIILSEVKVQLPGLPERGPSPIGLGGGHIIARLVLIQQIHNLLPMPVLVQ